ncbi:MAG: hypothetical protein ABEI99_06900 [Halobaculum sp.]
MGDQTEETDELQAQVDHRRRLAYLQFFRVSALFGVVLSATLVEIVALVPVLVLELVLSGGLLVSIRGVPVPILRLAEVVIAASVLWEGLKLKLREDPEFHKIEP